MAALGTHLNAVRENRHILNSVRTQEVQDIRMVMRMVSAAYSTKNHGRKASASNPRSNARKRVPGVLRKAARKGKAARA
jgi:hypothetical protein